MANKTKNPKTAEVKIDRRTANDRRQSPDIAKAPRSERRKVNRRRQIDPTTCERDYSGDEIEFMQAMDAYKRSSGRMFPTCSEILEVVRALGYARPSGMTRQSPSSKRLLHRPPNLLPCRKTSTTRSRMTGPDVPVERSLPAIRQRDASTRVATLTGIAEPCWRYRP